MRKLKGIIKTLLLAAVVYSCLYINDSLAYAAEADYHLGISPTQSNLGTVEPGKVYNGEFEVWNQGNKTAEYEIDIAPYSITNEKYEPTYDQNNIYTEITNWIKTSAQSGIIEPGKIDKIDFTITVPEDAHGGSQSAVIIIRLKQPAESDSTAVETVQQLGYLVFGNVDGEITRTAKILENKIPSFIFDPPIIATSVVENTGNVYTNASYTLQVFPLFGNEEVYTTEENPELKVIFPETKRYSEVAWEGAPALGIFRVKQTIKIFDEVSEVEKLVFLCPLWFIAIILLLIFLIIFWIVSRVRGRNRE